jgi:hypothetical protein
MKDLKMKKIIKPHLVAGVILDASVISTDGRYSRFVSGDLKLEKGFLTPTSIFRKSGIMGQFRCVPGCEDGIEIPAR